MGEIIGHLHPALVHLPIGIIIMAIIYEWWTGTDSILMWGMAFFTSLLAMGTGLVLLFSGYFEGLNMFLHMVMGYLTVALTGLMFIGKKKDIRLFGAQNVILKAVLLIVLMIGGHMGGELSHGENYLPNPLKESAPMIAEVDPTEPVVVYDNIIQPIFQAKCNRCHENGDERGKLNMQTKEGLLSDKYGDPAVAPGDLGNSKIYKRMSLHPWEHKYMPPSGPDLTYAEKRIIEWWILSGASFDKTVSDLDPPADIQEILLYEYDIELDDQSFYDRNEVPEAHPSIIQDLINIGMNVSPLADNIHYLEVNLKGQSSEVDESKLTSLLEIKDQLTWLDLSDSNLTDDMAQVISQFSNLTKLKIQNTQITDESIQLMGSLMNLNVLNIYNTSVTDESIASLSELSQLEKLYVWQTQISKEGINELKQRLPNTEIIGAAEI